MTTPSKTHALRTVPATCRIGSLGYWLWVVFLFRNMILKHSCKNLAIHGIQCYGRCAIFSSECFECFPFKTTSVTKILWKHFCGTVAYFICWILWLVAHYTCDYKVNSRYVFTKIKEGRRMVKGGWKDGGKYGYLGIVSVFGCMCEIHEICSL